MPGVSRALASHSLVEQNLFHYRSTKFHSLKRMDK
jgi:hypothetical protein